MSAMNDNLFFPLIFTLDPHLNLEVPLPSSCLQDQSLFGLFYSDEKEKTAITLICRLFAKFTDLTAVS